MHSSGAPSFGKYLLGWRVIRLAFSELSVTWNFLNKVNMNAYYFQRDKTAVLGTIKAQLPFSEGRYQLLLIRGITNYNYNMYNCLSFEFIATHPNRSK